MTIDAPGRGAAEIDTLIRDLYDKKRRVDAERKLVALSTTALPALTDALIGTSAPDARGPIPQIAELIWTGAEPGYAARATMVRILASSGPSGQAAIMGALTARRTDGYFVRAVAAESANLDSKVLRACFDAALRVRPMIVRRIPAYIIAWSAVGMTALWIAHDLLHLPDGPIDAIINSIGGGISIGLLTANANAARQRTLDVLIERSETRTVGILAKAVNSKSFAGSRVDARRALFSVLRRVTPNDREIIRPDEMTAILRLLDDRDVELVLTTTQALEQIGDERAIPKVERLVKHEDLRTRQQAEALLKLLRHREESERSSKLLLRGSALPGVLCDTLVRAAANTPAPDDNLLRSAVVGTLDAGMQP